MFTPRWYSRNELPDHVPGEVLVKVDRGSSGPAHEIIPFAFGKGYVEWRERNSNHWRLIAWVPVQDLC